MGICLCTDEISLRSALANKFAFTMVNIPCNGMIVKQALQGHMSSKHGLCLVLVACQTALNQPGYRAEGLLYSLEISSFASCPCCMPNSVGTYRGRSTLQPSIDSSAEVSGNSSRGPGANWPFAPPVRILLVLAGVAREVLSAAGLGGGRVLGWSSGCNAGRGAGGGVEAVEGGRGCVTEDCAGGGADICGRGV
eukprot:1157003-Pelagomonas_calceolata.AAC.3